MLSPLYFFFALALGRCTSAEQLPPIPSVAVSCPATPEGHWDCGRQIAEQFRDRFEKSLSTNSSWRLYANVKSEGHAQRVFDAMKTTAERVYPEYIMELKGMAVG